MARIYTIGHSTRSMDELLEALAAHGIQRLVDIRAFPMSRRLPWFNRESLEVELPTHDIEYLWMQDLGGRRKKLLDHSPNTGLRNDSFRNYADHMMSESFRRAVGEVVRLAEGKPTAIMCAERVWFRCHRMLVSDWLVAHGHEVLHIDAAGPARAHKLAAEGKLIGDDVIYQGLFASLDSG